jgi:hypothetical protein
LHAGPTNKMNMLAAFDNLLMDDRPRELGRLRRGLIEFLYFGFKNARSCLFVFSSWPSCC